MNLAEFKRQAGRFRTILAGRAAPIETFRDVTALLRNSQGYSDDVDYSQLCTLFTERLRHLVNPYRHRTVLEKLREPRQLNEAKAWLGLWVEAMAVLECSASSVPEWHRTYDTALWRAISALVRLRRGQLREAIEGWADAATICRQWLNKNGERRGSTEYLLLEADYYFFDGRAHRAEGELGLDRRPRTPEAFEEIAGSFAAGLEQMRKSDTLMKEAGESTATQEAIQLEYLATLCRYRSALLKKDLPTARRLLAEIEQCAPSVRMKWLPYFGTLNNSRAEKHFVDAFEALMRSDLLDAQRTLDALLTEQSLDESTSEERPRWKRQRLRHLAVRFLSGDANALADMELLAQTDLSMFRDSQYICAMCRAVNEERMTKEEAVAGLVGVFSLDAYPPEASHTPEGQDLLRWLPPFYRHWLQDFAEDEVSEARLLYLHWHYIAMITEFLCGLLRLKDSRGEIAGSRPDLAADFRLEGFDDLRQLLRSLGASMEWREINELADGIGRIQAIRGRPEKRAASLARNFIGLVDATADSLLPHPVKVLIQERHADGQVSLKLERLWASAPQDLELSCLEEKGLKDGAVYFLKPPFKRKLSPLYHEELDTIYNFHAASTFALPSSEKFALLVEGSHDDFAFQKLLDAFVPYWRARIELHKGGGSSLPDKWRELKGHGYQVVTIADADKRGEWEPLQPAWLAPDFEGIDPDALAQAVQSLWGDYVVGVDANRIREILRDESLNGGTVRRLRNHFRQITRTFSLPDDNEMKKQLRSTLSATWISRASMPDEIETVVLELLERAFGLRAPTSVTAYR